MDKQTGNVLKTLFVIDQSATDDRSSRYHRTLHNPEKLLKAIAGK